MDKIWLLNEYREITGKPVLTHSGIYPEQWKDRK